ncbi:MAG: hypothetical protein Q4B42_05550 [Oscillospiraceae bacterium]|nr:hypothetical protein [Oscillospiraceae bacterium]
MKYSVEEVFKDGFALLIGDDGSRRRAGRSEFAFEPGEGMIVFLKDGLFQRDRAEEKRRREQAAAALGELLGKK